ncbi:MAG: DEAD/DEAH box helicase [Planctomycetes bacterium]|nr:DEAD/DEAH box helicase [Planctomycetota bacterium]
MNYRWYQEQAIEAVMLGLDKLGCNPLVAAPTGVGKSWMMDGVIEEFLSEHPEQNILILSHLGAILEQDYETLKVGFKQAVGLYSMSLKRRDIRKITVAGIQSVWRKPELFSEVSLVIVDEAHLVRPEEAGMYGSLISALAVPVVGFTATPFRMDGLIYGEEKSLFTDLVYDLTSKETFKRLQDEGYLSKVYMKGTSTKMDTKGISSIGGDYKTRALANRFDKKPVTKAAVAEIVKTGKNYKMWLVNAINIAHAEHITSEFEALGIAVACVHSKKNKVERKRLMAGIKNGDYRAAIHVGLLSVGFDHPPIDLIALLRPTKSPVRYVQEIGRGMRPFTGKDHLLVLDFGSVVLKLGPIDDIQVRNKEGSSTGNGEPIMKECPDCGGFVHSAVRFCEHCEHEFKFKHGLSSTPAEGNITSQTNNIAWLKVEKIRYAIHKKAGKPDSLKVTYLAGGILVSEWICPSHPGSIKNLARFWMKNRGLSASQTVGITAYGLLTITKYLREPTFLAVKKKRGYYEVDGYRFN